MPVECGLQTNAARTWGWQVLRILPGILLCMRESCGMNSRVDVQNGSSDVALRCRDVSLRKALSVGHLKEEPRVRPGSGLQRWRYLKKEIMWLFWNKQQNYLMTVACPASVDRTLVSGCGTALCPPRQMLCHPHERVPLFLKSVWKVRLSSLGDQLWSGHDTVPLGESVSCMQGNCSPFLSFLYFIRF